MPGGRSSATPKKDRNAHDGGRLVHVGQGPRPLFAEAAPREHTGDRGRASLRRLGLSSSTDRQLRTRSTALTTTCVLSRLPFHENISTGYAATSLSRLGYFFPPSWLAPSAHSYVGHSFQRGFRHKMLAAMQVRSHYAGRNRIIVRLTSSSVTRLWARWA